MMKNISVWFGLAMVCLAGGLCLTAAYAQDRSPGSAGITPSRCPVYQQPVCREGEQLVKRAVPSYSMLAGCPTTMAVCEKVGVNSSCSQGADSSRWQTQCPDTRILDCNGRQIGVRECNQPRVTSCEGKPGIATQCPDTRLLDCNGKQIGVRECNRPQPPVVACPQYQQPICKAGEQVVMVDLPDNQRRPGCENKVPQCRPVSTGCEGRPAVATACPDTRILDCNGRQIGVRECVGPQVNNACPTYQQPACRADQQLVNAELPVQFRRQGCPTTMPICAPRQTACVPQPSCPDNRVLNCDATFVAALRNCPGVSGGISPNLPFIGFDGPGIIAAEPGSF